MTDQSLQRIVADAGLGEPSRTFLEHAISSLSRILPHATVSGWQLGEQRSAGARWASQERRQIELSIPLVVGKGRKAAITGTVSRRQAGSGEGNAPRTLDTTEHKLCGLIARRCSEWIGKQELDDDAWRALQNAFDEAVIASYLGEHLGGAGAVRTLLTQLHELAGQTYENSAIAFGCLLDPRRPGKLVDAFPSTLLRTKKFRVFSDGYRTAYRFSGADAPIALEDLELTGPAPRTDGTYPMWVGRLAERSKDGVVGIALSRQGDILVLQDRVLRLSYRFGRWQYWNHAHLRSMLKDSARAQHVPPRLVGRVVSCLYRSALDVSFRRSGGLLVLLRNRGNLQKIVRKGDAIRDSSISSAEGQFGSFLQAHRFQALPRNVVADLAAADGAIIMANSGEILAYGAILSPKKKGKLKGSEGSRTKAAIGASNYGLAVKISADGEIAFFRNGKDFMAV